MAELGVSPIVLAHVINHRSVTKAGVTLSVYSRYDYALQAMSQGRYDTWRDYDPADSLRFWGLRMQETGIIKESPNKIIADGSDWRFLEELKRELKA